MTKVTPSQAQWDFCLDASRPCRDPTGEDHQVQPRLQLGVWSEWEADKMSLEEKHTRQRAKSLHHPNAWEEAAFVTGDFAGRQCVGGQQWSFNPSFGNVDDGLRDPINIDNPIKTGDGSLARVIKQGSLPLMTPQENGEAVELHCTTTSVLRISMCVVCSAS